uniref:Transcriptional-regulating factor 1 n=1 Tax=Capra hircus TaxID=9925 RepID=A0A8C2SAQ5_CAPHI
MGDQQLYKTNHVAHGGENLFYQQPPLGVHGGLNHNYGNTVPGAGMDAPQASPISPHFPQDTRDGLGLAVGSKNLGQVDTSRQGGWGGHAGPGNHIQLRGNLTNSNMMWGAPAQAEPTDGYQYTYSQASEIRTQKLTSGVLHKLDSFTQVFANQNLRIQVNNMAQVLHTQSAVMDGAPDSALRQLLSQKPMEAPAPALPSRYQQASQQPHPGFTGGLSKPALQVGQHPSQGHMYYDYQQPLAQMPVQGGQSLQAPQMLSQHMQQLQPHQYYPPQQQPHSGQQRVSMQEMQPPPQQQIRPPQPQPQPQPRQGSMQIPQYYQSPPMIQPLPEPQQPQMHLQDPHQYTPEQAHAVQLIQLGSMPQYYYQEPQQPYGHPVYQQSHLPQHQQPEDSQPKTYPGDRQAQAMLSSHGDLGPPDTGMGDTASSDLNRASSALPHRPLLSPGSIHLNNMGSQHQQLSPSAVWPQMHLPDGRAQPGSPESSSGQPKGVFGEQFDAKNKLTCSICLKEFKSLPALNGHMRASPSLKQEIPKKHQPATSGFCAPDSIDGSNLTVTPGPGEQTVDVEPRINIGLRFQAEIPELQDVSALAQDTHRATLVWKPWPELENHDLQQRVENLLNLCCSSALPGGGTNSEFALHSLFEAKGDVMAALEMLLLRKPVRLKCHPLANYHYAGSDKWTSLERKLFNKALATYSKDFIFVQKMVKSKTVAQCVEYYYTWKKIMRLGRKHRTRLSEIIDDCVTSEEDEEVEEEEDPEEDRKSTREEESELPKSPEPPQGPVLAPAEGPPLQALGQPSGSFICEMPNCGAVFSSRQALNGHARIHGGTNQVTKARGAVPSGKQKPGSAQSGYCSVKSSPSHSTTSGETDPTTIFPCKECGKVFFKIKSRNAHMKTHRQQEEQQRQKAQKAAFAAEMAATIERTTGPVGPQGLLPLDQLSLIKPIKDVDLLDDDVVQQLGGVMAEAEVVDTGLLLDDQASVLLQGDTEL